MLFCVSSLPTEHVLTRHHAQANHQAPAVMGIALIAMGEPVGTQMSMRALEHLLQYGEQPVRRAVPLAIALLNTSGEPWLSA